MQTQKCPGRSTREVAYCSHAWHPKRFVCRRSELVAEFFFGGGFFLGTHVKDAFKLSWIVVQYEYEYGKFFTWFQCERRLQVSDNIAKKNKHETKKRRGKKRAIIKFESRCC